MSSSMINRRKSTVAAAVLAATVLLLVFHQLIFDVVVHFWHRAESYHVNPLIFVFLLLATFYHYYKGWYQIAIGIYRRDRKLLVRGVILNRTVWAIPYLYVLIFGYGYPWWVLAGVIGWIVVAMASFIRNYRRPEYLHKMNASWFGRIIERHLNKAKPKVGDVE